MKTLITYIFEQETQTLSNKERKRELEKWLKHKKYADYVETINKMLEDPKSAALLKDGFGGELGDTKLQFSVKEIPVSQLIPTQKEIDLDKSIKHILKNRKSVKETFETPIIINKPIVTFRQNYIIDGHHTWLQAILLNPTGKILAFNYDGDISPIQMLKCVQGTIAAVKAEDNNNNSSKLPSNFVKGVNIFDDSINRKHLKKYIEDNFDDSLIDLYCSYIKECYNRNDIIKFLIERLLDIKSNNYPFEFAQSRNDMPQVYKGGTDLSDKSAYPDNDGSAMNKMKNNKFVKAATK